VKSRLHAETEKLGRMHFAHSRRRWRRFILNPGRSSPIPRLGLDLVD
jgi:hypothetical protein